MRAGTWIFYADHQTAELVNFGVLAPLHYAASNEVNLIS